jgi:GNAT superfamily N-acetyltransferase
MASPSFRRATGADIDRIARIHVDGWRSAYTGLIDESALAERTVDRRKTEWAELFAGTVYPDHLVYVMEVDGEVAGFARVGPSDDSDVERKATLNVFALYLDPGLTGQGFGRLLLDHVLERAKSSGYSLATLYVLVENERARSFYEKLGWEPEPDVVTDCLGDGAEALQMRYRMELSRPGATGIATA